MNKYLYILITILILTSWFGSDIAWGATFGNTTVGTSTNGTFNNLVGCLHAQAPENGTVNNINFYLTDLGTEGTAKGAIYVSSTDALISPVTNEASTTNGTGWETLTFSGGVSVTSGTMYKLCVWGSGTGQQINYDAVGGSHTSKAVTYTGTFPDPLAGGTSLIKRSIYVEYTTSSPATTPNISTSQTAGSISITSGSYTIQ